MSHQEHEHEHVDAVVIGAGFSGLFAAKRLLDQGLSVQGFDAGTAVGGVWNWNRYPGARTDSQHHTFCFSFSPELLRTWRYRDWYPTQEEVVGYLQHFSQTFDLARHFAFSTTVTSAHFLDAERRWEVRTDGGHVVRARYLVTAVGLVSEPNLPVLPGLEHFAGEVHHTSRWPQDRDVDFAGRRVAVIGTGSSGIQIVPAIAGVAEHLSVLQRTPNYVVPSGNRPVSDEAFAEICRTYDDVWDTVRANRAWHPYAATGRRALDATPEERRIVFEECWDRGGHALIQSSFDDVMSDRTANEMLCEFLRGKIRSLVEDADTAEALVPDYPYGAKRPPIGDRYFESFNRPDVDLVNLRKEPLVEFTRRGVRTTEREIELDMVVLATGFDASTGAFLRMDLRGRGGRRLADHWAAGPRTYLGVAVHGFPNLFMVAGPQSPFANLPPGAEIIGDWVADCVEHADAGPGRVLEPTAEAEREWSEHVAQAASASQAAFGEHVNSWFFGSNIEGKPRSVNVYFGGADRYAAACRAEADAGYPGFARD